MAAFELVENFRKSRDDIFGKVSDSEFIGIGNFIAYVAVNESEVLTASVPDITVEDGTTISDTIFLKPKIISIEGEVADVHIKDKKTNQVYRAANNAISQVTAYLPNRLNSEIYKIQLLSDSVRNAYLGIDDVLSKGDQLLNIFNDQEAGKKNTDVFVKDMRNLYKTRRLISIETGTGTHNDMAIESMEFRKTNIDNKVLFNMTFKQVRKKTVKVFSFAGKPSSGLGGQISKKVEKGINGGEKADTSLLNRALGLFK